MVYVHVPFCRSFCTYCDFYSQTVCRGRDAEMFGKYADDVCLEAQLRRPEIEETLALNTLYIGGGTPSVLPLSCLSRIVEAVGCSPYREFTVEVNPEDIVEKGLPYVSGLLELGVNRVSMGVQSLDDGILRWMNRRHDADGARKAYSLLREAGVPNISVDVISGLSHLDDKVLESNLREIISWAPEHISAYQLSIEDGSALFSMVENGSYIEADDEKCRRQYELTGELLSSAGYVHYEISNWAKPGFEAVHNSAYWRRLPYVGLGPGAHSLKGDDVRSWNSEELSGWTSSGECLTPEEIREEKLMLGLRTLEGVDGMKIPESDWFVSDSIIARLLS